MIPGSFALTDWSDFAAAAQVLSLPFVLLAVVVAGKQITSQIRMSRNEASFAIFLQFTDRFASMVDRRFELVSRFEAGDKTLDLTTVHAFYIQYWIGRVYEWEMFRAGLLPVEVYVRWTNYAHDNMSGEMSLGYFDRRGKKHAFSSREAFHTIALPRVLRGLPECHDFFVELSEIPHAWSPEADFSIYEAKDRHERLAAIAGLLTSKRKLYRARPMWKLD